MGSILDKPAIWSFREAAKIFGLSEDHGYRTISDIVRGHGIETKPTSNARIKGLDKADLRIIAKALNKKLTGEY